MECGIALGSNAGDRAASLAAAVTALQQLDPALEISPVYETAPVDCPAGSGTFLNAAAILHWHGSPEALLEELRGIESRLGRPPVRSRNAPRTIDLDILFAGNMIRSGEELILPHPRLHQRRFVLLPLSDLRPLLILPGFSRTVRQLLDELPEEDKPPRRLAEEIRAPGPCSE
jgi:2-amino-4-hydroxy-6-hydroxymethyldihydropteridine diphosphokinase